MRRPLVFLILLSCPVLTSAQDAAVLRHHDGWVGGVAFSPDSRFLATASADKTIQVIDLVKRGEPKVLRGHTDHVCAVAFSPDGQTVASASYDRTARLWDVAKGETRAVLKGHRGVVTSVAFSPNGEYLVTGGIDAKMKMWRVSTGDEGGPFAEAHKSWVNAVVFLGPLQVASASSDNTVGFWRRVGGTTSGLRPTFHEFPEGEVRSLALSPDGKTLAAGVRYGTFKIIDLKSGKVISKKAHAADVWAVAFSPDGKTLATGDGDWDRPGDVRLWDTATWEERKHLKTSGEVLALAFSPNGKYLAAGCWDKTVHLWQTSEVLKTSEVFTPRITIAKNVSDVPFTGRVFLIASRQPIKDGPHRQGWFKPEPFFAQDVKEWKPGEAMLFSPQVHFPQHVYKLAPGKYYMQAIADLDRGGQSPLAAPGSGFSRPLVVDFNGEKTKPLDFVIDQVVQPRKFVETERVKLVEVDSKLLTAFHKKPMRLRAAVVLPRSFAQEPQKRYPVIYEIPGFGGDHHYAFAVADRKVPDTGVEFLHVVLDPACRLGHHVFADSDNNGPCGRALVEELIPFLEKSYRGLGVSSGRFLTGHSSGGWSSLWLQVTYPDFFGGTWSTAPDPVDFRDFQKVNIYAEKNIFVDDKGQERPLSRKSGSSQLFYKSFSDMEAVLGRGGQLSSFEAVFSLRGADGRPMKLWDRATGVIDPKVARTWERYDIRLILERNWSTLGPKLAGKLRVYMGGEDTFFLEGATLHLQRALKDLGSDAVVEIFPGRHHGNLVDTKLRERIGREMAASFLGKTGS